MESEAPNITRIKNKHSHFMQKLRAVPIAAALAFGTPAPIEAQVHNIPTEVQNNSQDTETQKLQKEIENKYGVDFEGDWQAAELQRVDNILSVLPPELVQGQPNKITRFEKDDTWGKEFGYCDCEIRMKDGERDPEDTEYNTIIMGSWLLSSQESVNLLFPHELIHINQQILNVREIIPNSRSSYIDRSVWFQNNLEDVLGMSFREFTNLVDVKLQHNNPKMYRVVKQNYARLHEGGPILKPPYPSSFVELMTFNEWRTLATYDRWLYAVGKLEAKPTADRPIELVAVWGEWYIRGHDYFISKFKNIVPDEKAEQFYEYTKNSFFSGYEYSDYKLIYRLPVSTDFSTGHKK